MLGCWCGAGGVMLGGGVVCDSRLVGAEELLPGKAPAEVVLSPVPVLSLAGAS